MKKTKQEIMEAMLIHAHSGDCTGCPYADTPGCTSWLMQDALELLEGGQDEC